MDRCNNEKCCPSLLHDVLALNVGKDGVQRSSKKVACRLDALFCSIKKVGRCYLVVGLLVCKTASSEQRGPHRILVLTALLNECEGLLSSPCGRLITRSVGGIRHQHCLMATLVVCLRHQHCLMATLVVCLRRQHCRVTMALRSRKLGDSSFERRRSCGFRLRQRFPPGG